MASYDARPSRNTNSPWYRETYRFLTDDDDDNDDDDDLSSIFSDSSSLGAFHLAATQNKRRTRVFARKRNAAEYSRTVE